MKTIKNDILRKSSAFLCMLTLVISLVVISSMGSQAGTAQTADECKKLPIARVSASKETTEHKAQFAVDNDPNTRWRHQEEGAFIQLDLGQPTFVCSLDISWYKGNNRAYNFVVSISDDGLNFNDVVSAKSAGSTNSPERYNIPDVSTRFVRVTIFGSNESDLGSIVEMQINGRVCEVPQISRIGASGSQQPNIPQNTLDNNLNTRWSNFGFPSYIQYDLGESQPVCDVDIAWYRGNLRVNTFTIAVSNDGINFTPIFSGQSSGRTTGLESYNIPDTMGQYMRITVTGNSENDWTSITEVRINGGAMMECKSPQISDVEATGNDGNVPQNTIDNNLNTRWSNLGFPSWIQYDLGESQPICSVDIAWYRGNHRVNTFTISVSNDGTNFTPIFSRESSGETTGLESYNVPETMGRYMRITVTGNNENSWSSITEVRINGESQAPTPPREICGNGQDDDGDGQTDEGCQTGGSGADPFGIEKIYPTKAGSEPDEWFMDMSDGQDPRSRPPSMTKNSDGSFKVTSGQVRYNVFTTSGYNPDEVELDHGVLAQRGYMQSPNDWRNVEHTGYVKLNSGQSSENFAWYARGGRHTGSGSPEGCEGSSIKSNLGYDGRVRFAKEQWHVSYVFTDHKQAMSSLEDRWAGFKSIMYNTEQNGETVVKTEIWVDKNEDGKEDGPWEKVDENIDVGGWGDNGEECGGEPDQIITWGGPIATFRWDGASDVDIKNFSVREIQPPS